MKKQYIIMNAEDNCATSLADLNEGTEILLENNSKINVLNKIPLGHKFALMNIKTGEKIVKYGQIIGRATQDIELGDWIHTHNITSAYMESVK